MNRVKCKGGQDLAMVIEILHICGEACSGYSIYRCNLIIFILKFIIDIYIGYASIKFRFGCDQEQVACPEGVRKSARTVVT